RPPGNGQSPGHHRGTRNERPAPPVYLQKCLLHQVLRGDAVPCGFAQVPEQAWGNGIVELGEGGVVAIGVALHGHVRTIHAHACHDPHSTSSFRRYATDTQKFHPSRRHNQPVPPTETFASTIRSPFMEAPRRRHAARGAHNSYPVKEKWHEE